MPRAGLDCAKFISKGQSIFLLSYPIHNVFRRGFKLNDYWESIVSFVMV